MATFNFCKEEPPQGLVADFQRTNKLSEEQYDELLDVVFRFLSNPKASESLEHDLGDYATRHGINTSPLQNMAKSLIIVGNGMVKKNLSVSQIESDLQKMRIDDVHIGLFCKKWVAIVSVLQSSLLTSKLQGKKLVDFDWKFAVTAASSEMQQVGSCFIQVKLVLEDAERKRKASVIEMSLPQFYSLLHETEKAKISLESMA